MQSREMRILTTTLDSRFGLKESAVVYIGQLRTVNFCCGGRDRLCRCDECPFREMDVLGEQLDFVTVQKGGVCA